MIRVDECAPQPAEIGRKKLHLNFTESTVGAAGFAENRHRLMLINAEI
jgi:hypothetical protein